MSTFFMGGFKRIISIVVAAVMVVTTSTVVFANDAETVLETPDLTSYIDTAMMTDNVTGLSMVVVSGGNTAFLNRGYADIANRTLMTEDTPVYVGSCTKAFTALAVLLLEERGMISTDDSIKDYVSWWNVKYQGEEADVKIWQIMNHCAGIPNGPTMSAVEYGSDHSLTEKNAHIAEGLELSCAPGDGYEYCNLDYIILAYLVEAVSGMYFDDFVESQILQPIGMTHSGFDLPTAPGHISFFGNQVNYETAPAKGSEAEGHIVTTGSDMSLWLKAQMGFLDIPEDLSNAIRTSHVASESGHAAKIESNYFNGWYNDGQGVLWHTGLNPNYTAAVYVDPEEEIGVMVVCNCVSNAPENVAATCFSILKGNPDYSDQEPSSGYTMDLIASVMCIVFLAAIVLQIVLFVNQRKRFEKKRLIGSGISVKPVIGVIVWIVLFILSWFLQYGLSSLIGYQSFGYKMYYFWGYWSVIVMLVMLSVIFLLAAVRRIRGLLLRK